MRVVMRFRPGEVRPAHEVVLRRIGICHEDASDRLERLLARAARKFERCAGAGAVFERVTAEQFGRIYAGDGANACATPLDEISPRAEALAVFAGTLGSAVDDEIRRLFERGDPALAYVLDVIAGGAAEQLAQVTANEFARAAGCTSKGKALPYSPGYCGWHLTGQRALFNHLRPIELDLKLSGSCLMDPIKSVSGVVVVGPATIHRFRPAYSFCASCETKTCAARMRAIRGDGR